MNLKKISIGLFILVWGHLSAQSAPNEKTQGIKANFSQKSIEAHQENSQKKLVEFYEYLTLYSNENDSKLKKQIESNILSMVSSENIKVLDVTEPSSTFVQLSELLKKIENQGYHFEINQIVSSKNISLYEWENSYQLKITKNKKSEFRNLLQSIIFEPVEKKFGNNTKLVWEIKLNEISEN